MNRFTLGLLFCLFCSFDAFAQPPNAQAKRETIVYLQGLQSPKGGFLAEKPGSKSGDQPTLRSTTTAVQALKYLGGDVPNRQAASKFVTDCFDRSVGGFADTPGGKVDVTTTAVGLIVGTEFGLPAETYNAPAIKYLTANVKSFEDIRIAAAGLERINGQSPKQTAWIADVEKQQLPSLVEKGLNGRARMVASQAVTLMRLGQKLKNADEVLKELRMGQRADGGYGTDESPKSDLETTYRVMRAYMMLKTMPANGDALRAFIRSCRSSDNGYGVMAGQPSSASGTYYAVIIQKWLDELK